MNLSGGDYHLAAGTPYKNKGTDGKDPGADIDALKAALAKSTAPPASGTPTTPPAPADAAPTVALTSPASGATFAASCLARRSRPPRRTATATPVAKVEFYANGTLIGTDTTSPYSVSWTNVRQRQLLADRGGDGHGRAEDDVRRLWPSPSARPPA